MATPIETTIITADVLAEEAADDLAACEDNAQAARIELRARRGIELLKLVPEGWAITRESYPAGAHYIATPDYGLRVLMYAERESEPERQLVGWVGVKGTPDQALAQVVVIGLAALDAEARAKLSG